MGRVLPVIAQLEAMLAPIVESCGAQLYDLEYVKEGGDRILRLYIDKDGGVDLNDCEKVSHAVSDELDEKDPISTAYRLQVGSPGVERKLAKPEHFARYVGEKISVRLFAPHAPDDKNHAESITTGRKKFTGILSGFSDNKVKLTDADAIEWIFDLSQISACKLVVFGGEAP